ncbi:hypothetical protein ACHAPA_009115 [Fusarium lateritium]
MRVSIVILATLAGHSVASPCKPKWVVSKSKSWMSASTRLDKVLAELPTIYADGGTVPPNATATATGTVAGDEGDLSAASAGVTRNRHVSSTPGAAAASSGTPSAGADRSADASGATLTVTTTTTTITVTPTATNVAEADEASTKTDKASTEAENPKDPKMHRRGCPHRKVDPQKHVHPQVTYRTVTEVIPPATTPVVVVYKHVPCTKNNKINRRSFEGSEEEQKNLDMLSILAKSKMGEATNMRDLYDRNMEAFQAKQKALNNEKNDLKKQNSQAKSLMKEARSWDKKLHKAVREYNLKQQKWEEEMEKIEQKRIKQEKEAKKKKMKEKEKEKEKKEKKEGKEKRDESSHDLSKEEKKNEKREPYFLSKEQYEDKMYEIVRERLRKKLAKQVKEHGAAVLVFTKQDKVLKCDKPNGCKGIESIESQQGLLDFKVQKEDEETKEGEKKETKQEDTKQEKTEKAKEAELEEDEHEDKDKDEDKDEEVKLLADGDEHEQYTRISTLYMQYRRLLAEGIQKKLDPILKDDKYAGDEIKGEHEEGDEREQLRRLTNLYLDFRYMLLPKFKKQLDPILHEGNL